MAQTESVISRAIKPEGELERDQLFDVLFVVKQIIGFVLGIVITLVGLRGIVGLIAYAVGASVLVYLYVYRFKQTDEDAIETKDVLKEHFMNGFFVFIFTWVISYNLTSL